MPTTPKHKERVMDGYGCKLLVAEMLLFTLEDAKKLSRSTITSKQFIEKKELETFFNSETPDNIINFASLHIDPVAFKEAGLRNLAGNKPTPRRNSLGYIVPSTRS